MPELFISYRRDDSQGYAGRLADDLSTALGPQQVFSDIEIPAGSDFAEVLHRAVGACSALLVVIGRRWAAESAHGQRSRLFEPGDWVRVEIESAFDQGKLVVPVLVGGTVMPSPDTLPRSLQRLTRVQAAELSDRHWDADLALLVDRLRTLLPALGAVAADAGPGTPDADAAAGAAPQLAQVLREIADRVLDPALRRPPPSSPPRARPSWFVKTLRPLVGGLGRVLTLLLLMGAVYAGLRLFGDAATLRQLDAVEAQLLVGWQRLQALIASR